MPLGSLSNKDGNGYENLIKKVNCAASNLIALIPSRLIRQMLANGFGVNFLRTVRQQRKSHPKSAAASNFMALIAVLLISPMLAIFSGVEF